MLQAETECNTPTDGAARRGLLTITTSAQATTCGDFNVNGSVRHAAQSWPYKTGDVQWRTKSFTYGTVEVRAKFPAKQASLWPAIWLLGANCQNTNPFTADQNYLTCPDFSPSYAEIDIVECDLNNWCQLALWTGGSFPTCGYNVDTDFHTFTLTWTPSLVSVAIDGKSTGCSFTDHTPNTPMFLILQTQTGGNGGNPNSAFTSAQFVVDYVRVTQPVSPAARADARPRAAPRRRAGAGWRAPAWEAGQPRRCPGVVEVEEPRPEKLSVVVSSYAVLTKLNGCNPNCAALVSVSNGVEPQNTLKLLA